MKDLFLEHLEYLWHINLAVLSNEKASSFRAYHLFWMWHLSFQLVELCRSNFILEAIQSFFVAWELFNLLRLFDILHALSLHVLHLLLGIKVKVSEYAQDASLVCKLQVLGQITLKFLFQHYKVNLSLQFVIVWSTFVFDLAFVFVHWPSQVFGSASSAWRRFWILWSSTSEL